MDNEANEDPLTARHVAEQGQRLREAMVHLTPGQREAVEAIGLREQSLEEAAATTGKSKGALKVNFHRALKALRDRLQRDV